MRPERSVVLNWFGGVVIGVVFPCGIRAAGPRDEK